MFGDMMNKLQETQKKVEETKERLKNVSLQESTTDDLLKVTISAAREIKQIEIADELVEDKEQLEDYLILTLNKAIQKANDMHEAEIAAVAKQGMPNIPGMDMFK
ncbi:YbaB/EbfC family nucleoid-associated protein [uncultured Mesonia sp.]|uniref:YbaB/EbfC family nucleoid-associated protein n=1 Tax=uncultured Mesonia sp. TaxID=399731 RepID=UPI00374F1B88